jgi:hypothetical protein
MGEETSMRKRSAYRATGPVVVRTAQVARQAPQVVAQRPSRLAAAGSQPTTADWHESQRMAAEKAAAAQGWHAALCVADRGLDPMQRRVGADAQRLAVRRR